MKRFSFILLSLSALFVLSFSSCETTNSGEESLRTETVSYSIRVNDWQVGYDDESGDYWYYSFREPALTSYIFDNGIMAAYMRFSDGRLTPLPFSDFWVDRYGYKWEEQVTCDIEPGRITFICKSDDHSSDKPYYNYEFVLKLAWR